MHWTCLSRIFDLLGNFLDISPEQLLGRLTSGLAKEGFDTTATTTLWGQIEVDQQFHRGYFPRNPLPQIRGRVL